MKLEKKQEPQIKVEVSMVFEDRDRRNSGRRGVVTAVTKDRATVSWNTGKITTLSFRTLRERFRVVLVQDAHPQAVGG